MNRSDKAAFVAASILGFAFGGFFDGIVLHQVLQWHHFLSLVPGERFRDIHTQILADGLFHIVVYVIAAFGLWLLWRRGVAASDRVVAASAFLGFAIWQFADVVIFHWAIGIHRIRVDVPNPLAWDVGWLVVFGVPSLLIGVWLMRKGDGHGPGQPPSRVAASVLSLALLVSVPISWMPPSSNSTMVVFRPGVGASQSFAAVAAIDARVIWSDPSGELMAIKAPSSANTWRLYTRGAILVGNAGSVAGCLGWLKI